MAKLLYRTLTGSSPRGKQKIYFCCHPDDFNDYFESICRDIFNYQKDCTIYYDAEPQKAFDSKDLPSLLGEMRLFVVPVTKKLLTEKNRAITHELPFAMGQTAENGGSPRHIAILPILGRDDYPELCALYNNEVKDNKITNPISELQFIDKLQRDKSSDSAIGYQEKLKKRLESVLVGEEKKRLIRSHFRARLFMSYRKDSRKYLIDLIRRIHRIDFCRDVSTWYDEFLIPGEEWKDDLDIKMKDCDLFVLSLTDDITETSEVYKKNNKKGNYVSNVEFPKAAKTYRKPVLPVEMQPVDHNELTEIYNTPCPNGKIEDLIVPLNDDYALRQGLERELITARHCEELNTPNNDPEHLYYIGLAYKNNIDVEIDPERSVDLLERSGAGGFSEAFFTLGKMYEYGDTVPVDRDKAIKYYDDYIESYKPRFGTSKDCDTHFVEAYDAKGMIYINSSQLSKALDCYSELNEQLRNMRSCYGSFQMINLPISYTRLSIISQDMGDITAAKEYMEKAIEVSFNPPRIKNIATEKDSSKGYSKEYNARAFNTSNAVLLHTYGGIYKQNGDIRSALNCFLRSNKLFCKLIKKNDDPETMLMLAKSDIIIGDIYRIETNRKTNKYYSHANFLLSKLINDPDNLEARALYAALLCSRGDYYRMIASAYSYAAEEKHYRESVVKEYDAAEKKHYIEVAEKYYNDALKQALELIKLDSSDENTNLLAHIYSRLGKILDMDGRTSYARSYYEGAIAISERIAEHTDKREYLRNLAISYEDIADSFAKRGNYGFALEYLEKDLDLTQKLLKGSRGDLQAMRDLSVCYSKLSEAYEKYGDKDPLEYAVKDLIITQQIIDRSERHVDEETADHFASSCNNIGRLCPELKEYCSYQAKMIYFGLYRGTHNSLYLNKQRSIFVGTIIGADKMWADHEKLLELTARYNNGEPVRVCSYEKVLSMLPVGKRPLTSAFCMKIILFDTLLFAIVYFILDHFGMIEKLKDWLSSLLG